LSYLLFFVFRLSLSKMVQNENFRYFLVIVFLDK
jgi:hypothetical protein